MSNLVSIIVPVYNAGAYLQPMIDSVLNQTWKNLELILVDDGSSDGSAGVCDAAAAADSRVRVIHKANGGQSAARNTGLDAASGSHIAFADHDDILHPRLYETLLEAMAALDADEAACGFANTPQEKIHELVFDDTAVSPRIVTDREIVSRYFTPAWHIPIWNKVYRRELLEGLCFSDLRLGEDNLFSYRVIKRAGKLAFVDKTMYFQRMHGNNFEFTGYRHLNDLLRAKEMVLKDVRLAYPDLYLDCQKMFLHECIRVYNVFCRSEDIQDEKMDEIKRFIRRNATHILRSHLPRGHKLLFLKLKYFPFPKNRKEIGV